MRVATIDIGTNTTLLLIVETGRHGVRVLAERAEITRLGRGIGKGGELGSEGVARTLAVLKEYAALARSHNAVVYSIGTEALRRATNAMDFLAPASEILGKPVEVIDGDREAALTLLATTRSFPRTAAETMVVLDIGGGSTEIIVARGARTDFRTSLPMGSVRLTEQFIHGDPAKPEEITELTRTVTALLENVPFPSEPFTLVGVAGTVTTLAAMALGLANYDSTLVHGYCLTSSDLEEQVQRLLPSTQSERETMLGLDPKRADVILAGATILSAIAHHTGAPEILVSDRGIRWGLLFEKA